MGLVLLVIVLLIGTAIVGAVAYNVYDIGGGGVTVLVLLCLAVSLVIGISVWLGNSK